MKYLGTFVIGLALLLTGCGSGNEYRSSAAGEEESAEYTLENERRSYVDDVEYRLEELEIRIDQMREDLADAGAEIRVEIEEDLDDLEVRRQTVRDELEELKDSTANAWRSFKADVDRAMEDFERAYEQARARFTS